MTWTSSFYARTGIGFATGILGGLIGLGGAEFRLPYLIGVLGLAPRQAVPVNLAISLATVLAAFPPRLLSVAADTLAVFVAEAASLAAGAIVAAFLGAGWLKRLSDRHLSTVLFVLLLTLGVALIAEGLFGLQSVGLVPDQQAIRLMAGFVLGLAIGFTSSLLGVAGGEIIIPTLVLGFGTSIKVAGSLSLLISLPTVAVGLTRYAHQGLLRDRSMPHEIIAPMAIGSIAGAILGGLLLGLVPPEFLKLGLGAALIWSAWKAL